MYSCEARETFKTSVDVYILADESSTSRRRRHSPAEFRLNCFNVFSCRYASANFLRVEIRITKVDDLWRWQSSPSTMDCFSSSTWLTECCTVIAFYLGFTRVFICSALCAERERHNEFTTMFAICGPHQFFFVVSAELQMKQKCFVLWEYC